MTYDISTLCRRACELFGGPDDGIFNSANFAHAVQEATGLMEPPGGVVVSLILSDRPEVESLAGCHWRWKKASLQETDHVHQ